MRVVRWSLRLLYSVLFTLIVSSSARAQITAVSNSTSTPAQGIGHDYIKMLNETVNPANGSVSLRIQVPVPPGRRLTLPFSFNYDSNGTTAPRGDGYGGATLSGASGYLLESGWSYGLPVASNMDVSQTPFGYPTCHATTGYVFQDSAGTRYSFNKLVGFTHYPRTCLGDVDKTTDGTNDFYSGSITGYASPLTVYSLANTVYTFNFGPNGGCGADLEDPGSTLPATIEDRNGNIVTFTGPPTTCDGSFMVKDTLGRTVLSSSGFRATGNTVTVSGLPQPYTLTWGTVGSSYTPGFTWDNPSNSFCSNSVTGGGGGTVVTAITLPNGKQYTFSYDPPYGMLSKITYPNGGYISYTWGANHRSDFTAVVDSAGDPQVCEYTYDNLAITHRYVSYDGSTIAQQQDFSYSTTWNPSDFTSWTSKSTSVTTYDLIRGTSFQTSYTYSPVQVSNSFPWLPSFFGSQIPVEQTIVYKDTNGSTLRTVTKTWYDQYEIKSDQTTLDNGQSAQVNFTWTSGLITEKDEFDFGQTTPTRKTLTTYVLDQPATIKVQDGNGNTLAETDSTFDAGTTVAVSNLPPGTHDETNYGPSSTTTRANATSITRRCLQAAPGCASGDSTTTYTYDETGQALSMTDPRGNTTQYSFADSFDSPPSYNMNAYLTKVTRPITNGVNHISNLKYAFADGQRISSTDENGLITQYLYNDSLRRPTETDFPDGGQTLISYNDTAPTPTITTSKKINTTQTLTTVSVSDGVGHPKQSQLTSDPQGIVYTDTTYDGFGHVMSVSNPYRSGSDPTTSSGTTSYVYDSLGRKISETEPDGSVITTAYCGPSTLVTDPTSKWRRSRVDGLGRLVEVDEPNAVGATVNSNGCPGTGEPIWVTSYSYDPLGNLTQIVQNGSRTRNFTYDSLSRLLCSSNPESSTAACPTPDPGTYTTGTTRYSYDAAGNVATKTDARVITATYAYDALNRLTSSSYSNGDPMVTTTFDQATCLGLSACQNIGFRTSVTDAAGSEAWSYQVDATNHRTVHVDQRTTNSSPSNITKNSTYYLDLSGNVTQAVYPTGRVVNYTYDSADRPSTAIDGSNGITYATDFQTAPTGCLANAVCYTPQGSFYALSIGQTGSFSGLNLTHTYNSRLQPNEFKASSAGGNAIDITYGFVDPVTSKNASHVYSITNNLDSTRSQTFTYDQLNRVATALTTSTYATSPSHCWGETYSLDAWGNLQSIAATTNPNYTGCTQESGFTASADGNNHLSGFSYDASGNTLGDGTNTYTWDGESQLKSSAGVNYLYDGDGRRVYKSNGKLYWYGSGGDILAETDASGNTLNEYIFFGGKRVAMLPASSTPIYYVEDLLGTSRIITSNTGVVCYDADFYPFGGERSYTNTCPQNYKFEGKERDSETGNDDFGARYYSNRFGRWLSADWSAVPVPVPYANLTNPQTLNLYSMVADDPESFADLDGHSSTQTYQVANPGGGFWDPTFATSDTGLFTGDNTPQENPSPRLGIGIEVPASSAVNNNVLNVANDPGHAFVYLKDSTGKVVSMLSFGPGQWILDNKDLFQTGGLAGNAHWSLTGSANTWESNITSAQLTTGIKAIADFKSNVPNFTPSFQCAAAALSIVQKVGLTLPNGVGPVVANKFGKTYFSGNVANPYHLNQQMTKQFGPPQVVKTSTFPAP